MTPGARAPSPRELDRNLTVATRPGPGPGHGQWRVRRQRGFRALESVEQQGGQGSGGRPPIPPLEHRHAARDGEVARSTQPARPDDPRVPLPQEVLDHVGLAMPGRPGARPARTLAPSPASRGRARDHAARHREVAEPQARAARAEPDQAPAIDLEVHDLALRARGPRGRRRPDAPPAWRRTAARPRTHADRSGPRTRATLRQGSARRT